LVEQRGEQAQADLQTAFANKQPADVAPVVQTAQDILSSPDGIRPAVQNAVKSVLGAMTDPTTGKMLTDPEMLYGVRKHIDDLLSPAAQRETPMAARVVAQLSQLKGSLDGVIEQAAPGFKQYLQNFAQNSAPIDEMGILQEYKPKIVNAQNQMTYSGVQRMMRDIVTDRAAKGVNPAQSISDDTMAKLWALRDDLRRVASSEDLAKARGSDTAQNAMDIIKHAGSVGISGAAHGIANFMAPGVGSLGVNIVTNKLRQGAVRRGVAKALNPDRNRLAAPPPD
jgi:hypothetical protein